MIGTGQLLERVDQAHLESAADAATEQLPDLEALGRQGGSVHADVADLVLDDGHAAGRGDETPGDLQHERGLARAEEACDHEQPRTPLRAAGVAGSLPGDGE